MAAATGDGKVKHPVSASAALVVISERQVMFASAAGTPARTAVTRRSWIVVLWQRLSVRSEAQREPRRGCPSRRPVYIERAAMARAMERL